MTVTEIVWSQSGLQLRLTLAAENTWRLQSAMDGAFDDMGAAQTLAKDLGEPCLSARLPFETSQAERILSSFGLTIHQEGESISVRGALSQDEALFGCGQQFNAANQRGRRVELMAIDKWCQTEGNSYVPVPFIHSTRGYALFLNRYEHAVFDLGASDENAWEMLLRNAPLDLYIFENTNPARTLKAYSQLTGFAPMPAPWLFGIQVCRYWPDFSTAEGILEFYLELAQMLGGL